MRALSRTLAPLGAVGSIELTGFPIDERDFVLRVARVRRPGYRGVRDQHRRRHDVSKPRAVDGKRVSEFALAVRGADPRRDHPSDKRRHAAILCRWARVDLEHDGESAVAAGLRREISALLRKWAFNQENRSTTSTPQTGRTFATSAACGWSRARRGAGRMALPLQRSAKADAGRSKGTRICLARRTRTALCIPTTNEIRTRFARAGDSEP